MSERIRVCQLTPCLWSGGTEERVARVLAGMPRDRFEPSWVGFGPIREALIDKAGPRMPVVPWPRNPTGGIEPALVARIAAELRRLRPHVLHVHNWSTSLYGIAAARLAGVPRVLYGSGGREVREGAGPRRQRAMRTLAPFVDRFTAVCRYLGDELAEDFGVGPDRIRVLPTGVDIDHIDGGASRDEARRALGLPEDALVVGAITVFRPVKRIPDLIEAASRIAAKHPRLHVLLVGNPVRTEVDEIRTLGATLGDRLHLPGRAEDPAAVLRAFDVFVSCSAFEGSSNAIIEALAAGLPVIGTAVGGTPELVGEDRGLLVEPGDVGGLSQAIERLLLDPKARARFGAAARRFAGAHHSLEAMIGRYLALYVEEAQTPATSRARSAIASARQLIAKQ